MSEQQLHERLRELLRSARAESCRVVATFLDIRGFSTFSAQGESFDSALYLRSVFNTILSAHFDDTVFFKPTGDGLLLIHELPEKSLEVRATINSILSRAVTLVNVFGQITANDYTINFPVPQKLGIGIARGSATRLISDGGVLDYTGRCLNLAARLMDKARPSGVVFADTRAEQLMTPEVAQLFTSDQVCIRGISEQKPMPIMISADVEITALDREPLSDASKRWGDAQFMTVTEVRNSSDHAFYLPRPPRSYERVGVHVEYPFFDKSEQPKNSVSRLDVYGDYLSVPDGSLVKIDFKAVKDEIKQIPETTMSKITEFLHYPKPTYVKFTPFLEPIEDEDKM
jgi:class 3 adenylate cyclase